MPFAPAIQKSTLRVLNDTIIPALEAHSVPQILAEPPFDFQSVPHAILQKYFLPDKPFTPLQSVQRWDEAMVMAANTPTVMIAYEGICYERVGITEALAQELEESDRNKLGGVNILQLAAPSVLCHPAYMLRSLGMPRPESQAHAGKSLLYRLAKNGIWVSLNTRGPQEESVSHALEINDAALLAMGNLYIDELRAGELAGAQALQLAFLCRLRRHLTHHRTHISNSSWVTPSDDYPPTLSPTHRKLCHEVTAFMITHLHAPLTLQSLADQFDVSAVHLNNIFKHARGTTVMRYVTWLRVEAAKAILIESTDSIKDVANLTGFASAASFGLVFKNYTGKSPREFRQEINREK